MMSDSAGTPGFFAMLFFGADISARRAIRAQLAELREVNRGIAEDHSLDELIDDIKEAKAEGIAAMEGMDDER